MGLSICKTIIDKLGYKIRFETEENYGTAFHIDIPHGVNSTIENCQVSNFTNIWNTQLKFNSNENEIFKDFSINKGKERYYNINQNYLFHSQTDKDYFANSNKFINEESFYSLCKTIRENDNSLSKIKNNLYSENTKRFFIQKANSKYFKNFQNLNSAISDPDSLSFDSYISKLTDSI